MWWASQAQGLIHDIDTCAHVVEAIIDEAEAIIRGRLSDLVVESA
jgi:nitronate monooxygenase